MPMSSPTVVNLYSPGESDPWLTGAHLADFFKETEIDKFLTARRALRRNGEYKIGGGSVPVIILKMAE